MIIEFAYNFWCEVGNCPNAFIGCGIHRLHLNSTTEVYQFSDSFLFIVNDIFEFYIPVHGLVEVQVVDGQQNLMKDTKSLCLTKFFLLLKMLEQLFAFD